MIWFVLLVLWPLAELYVIVRISEAIGFLWMLLLLILTWPVGSRIIRHQGRAALRRLREALAAGRAPTTEVLDGALVLGGGVLLLVPGFITDAIGLLLLLPPTRALARRGLARHHASRWLSRTVTFISWGARGPRGAGDPSYDAEATAADIDEPQLEA
jgi:UPF0716 protein FxsA